MLVVTMVLSKLFVLFLASWLPLPDLSGRIVFPDPERQTFMNLQLLGLLCHNNCEASHMKRPFAQSRLLSLSYSYILQT